MKKILIISIIAFAIHNNLNAQGCVAIKSNGGYCTMANHNDSAAGKKKDWLLSINNRYFKSYKHFVGTQEQKQRVQEGTEVINHANTTDFNITKNLKDNWSVSVNLPVIANTRSSLYEHGGKSRHSTKSFGLGDVRMTKGNVQIGVGVKLPTGDYKYQDNFFVNDSTQILGPVDQSVQLGDGGLGFTAEINAYYNVVKRLKAYANFYYLLSPREQNGTSTARGSTPSVTAVRYGSHVMSVPDQYMIRAGFDYQIKQLTVSAGVRNECLPVHDLIGGSNGFRRPGYIISFEPGLTYEFKKFSAYAYVPVALKRSRTQSVADKIRTDITGVYAQGDAAFADYAVNIGVNFKF
jgi:hypothetical protein